MLIDFDLTSNKKLSVLLALDFAFDFSLSRTRGSLTPHPPQAVPLPPTGEGFQLSNLSPSPRTARP